jgi:hypothetical protein
MVLIGSELGVLTVVTAIAEGWEYYRILLACSQCRKIGS